VLTVVFVLRFAAVVVVFLLAHVIGAAAVGFTSSTPRSGVRAAASQATSAAAASPETARTAASAIEPDNVRGRDAASSLILLGWVAGACVLEALATVALVLNARACGWRLVGGLCLAQFGVMTLQPQIEALAFGVIRASAAVQIAGMGLVMAMIVAPAAVVLYRRLRPPPGADPGDLACTRAGTRTWKMVLVGGVLYVVIYLIFGYFIAWQSAVVRAYYGGGEPAGFVSHVWALQARAAWFLPFQLLRGCLWGVLAWLVLGLLRGPWWRAGAVVGLYFALMMNAQLMLPNALMPEAVRLIHIAETAPCNFVLGIVLAWLLRAKSAGAARDWRSAEQRGGGTALRQTPGSVD